MHRVAVCLTAVVLALCGGGVLAQSEANWKICAGTSSPPDEAIIAACTRLITSGRLSTPDLAIAFYNRGLAWAGKRDYDRAIADYTEALRLNPQDAIAYNNRGLAWAHKRDYDRAIADYNEALRLNPQHADAYINRGNAWFAKRDYDRAITDYTEALRFNPRSASAHNQVAWALATSPAAGMRNGTRAVELARRAAELSDWKDANYQEPWPSPMPKQAISPRRCAGRSRRSRLPNS